jgi:hypothetical protein
MTIPRYTCRKCKTKVNEDIVEAALQYLLKSISLSPQSLCGDNNNDINLMDKQNRLELLKKDLKLINKKINTLVDLAGDNSIDKETFSSGYYQGGCRGGLMSVKSLCTLLFIVFQIPTKKKGETLEVLPIFSYLNRHRFSMSISL